MIENINVHINYLDAVSNRLFELKTVLQEMEENNKYDVDVRCSESGNSVTARVVSGECDERFKELRDLMGKYTDITYDPEGDCYIIDSTFSFSI